MIKCPNCGEELPEWWTLSATLPAEARDVYDSAVEALRAEGFELHGNRRVAAGQVVEALAASYLASARVEREALEASRGD